MILTPPAPQEELEYHELYRAGRQGKGWPVAGIITAIVGFFVVQVVVLFVFVAVFAIQGGGDLGGRLLDLGDFSAMTPAKFLFVNLSLISVIPVMLACTKLFHGLSPRWLLSVTGRIRWGWLLVSMGLALVTLIASVVLGLLLPGSQALPTDGVREAGHDVVLYVLMVALLTPIQSAAEEFIFRGYLTQAFGVLLGSRAVTVLVPALLFAVAHSPQPFTAFVDRFAFGVASGILVIATGGIEAGIAYHIVNNVLSFGIVLASSNMSAAFNLSEGGWADLTVSLLKSVGFVSLAIWTAHRMGIATRARAGGLEPPRARV